MQLLLAPANDGGWASRLGKNKGLATRFSVKNFGGAPHMGEAGRGLKIIIFLVRIAGLGRRGQGEPWWSVSKSVQLVPPSRSFKHWQHRNFSVAFF